MQEGLTPDDLPPASAEVVAHAVAEARAALSRVPRPRPAEPTPAATRSTRLDALDQADALAALFAALRRLRAAVSEVEAALADASPWLSHGETPWTQEKAHEITGNNSQAANSPDTESRADADRDPTP